MNCPFCKESIKKTRVIDTREVQDGIRRRRQCEACKQRFTTYERVASVSLMVIKSDKRRESFNREKLIRSLQLAYSKRPVSSKEIVATVDVIEEALYDEGRNEIHSSQIGEMVMNHLQEHDGVAYVRFASVYRQFQDVDTIAAEIERLQAFKRKATG